MKKYFLYELKKSGYVILCLTLIATVLYTVPIITSDSVLRSSSETFVWIISTIAGVLAACVPVWVFHYKMKKRSVDLYYSLPISHTKILAVKFLIGLIAVFAAYTVAYWIGAVALIIRYFATSLKADYPFEPVWYLPQYFGSILPIFFIYAISSFVFTRANKTVDGIFFIVFWMFVAALIISVLDCIIPYNSVYPSYFCSFAPLDILTGHFQEHLRGYLNIHTQKVGTAELVNLSVGFPLTALLAAGATAGLFLTEKRSKAENVEQISESPFGYKVMIPLYTVCLILRSAFSMFLVLLVMIAAGSYLLTMLYRRTVKIGWKQGIIYGASVLGPVVIIILYLFIMLLSLSV